MSGRGAAQIGVSASPAASADGAVAQVIASLPVSLRPVEHGGELVAVAGTPGWPDRAGRAVDAGALGVVVDDPVVVHAREVEALAERARATGAAVVVDTTWAHDPAVAASAPHLAGLDDPEALLEARVDAPVGADTDQVLLAQLALVRAALAPVARLRFLRRDARGYTALAELETGSTATVSAVLTDALPPSARLRVVRPRAAVAVHVHAPTSAVPGTVRVSGDEGSTLLPTLWESAHRVAWRRAHALVTGEGEGVETRAGDLDALAADLRVIAGASGAAT